MNSLASSASPYLQLFADSAVDWIEYDEDLFTRARMSRKVVHVSIGRYLSTRTTVERQFYKRSDVGDVLNDLFINVKIDADERPDLERFFTANFEPYGRRANAPMFELNPTSLFIEPQRLELSMPRVYFSMDPCDDGNEDSAIAANEVLNWHVVHSALQEGAGSILLSEAHRRGRLNIEAQPVRALDALVADAETLRQQCIEVDEKNSVAIRRLVQDLAWKLIRLWFFSASRSREDTKGLDIALIGLTRWVRGEMFDHVEGGFYAPMRFRGELGADLQKSLDFNAWSLDLLLRAVAISHDALLTRMARQTADFIVERLAASTGGFMNGMNDPENSTRLGWNRRTLRRTLSEDEYLVIETLYGLDKKPNWHGRWLLRRMGSWRSVVDQLFFSAAEAEALLESGLAKMREFVRERDDIYQFDERRLTASNAHTISALLLADRLLGESSWSDMATRSLRWLLADRLVDEGLVNAHGSAEGVTLVDHALLLQAVLDALAHQWDQDLAAVAKRLVDLIKVRYWNGSNLSLGDADVGGCLMKLPQSHQLGKVHPIDAVRRSLQRFATLYQDSESFVMLKRLFDDIVGAGVKFEITTNPSADFALDFRRGETVVVLRGPEAECHAWREQLASTYKPWRHVYCIPYSMARQLPEYLPRMMSIEQRERMTAYVSHDGDLLDPISSLDEVEGVLDSL